MLTTTTLNALRPRVKPYKQADEKGLFVIVRPDGGLWWRFKYRLNGRERQLSFGIYPDVTLKRAREKRDAARQLLDQGIDPSARRKAEKLAQSDTFEAIALEWLDAGCPGGRSKNGVNPETVKQLRHRLQTYVFPYLGRSPIAQITASEQLKVLRRIESRGAHETAHRVRSVCARVFRYAIRTGRAERNPASELAGTLAPAKTQHFAAITDPHGVGGLMRAIDCYSGQPVTVAALQILALTFVRSSELRLATWSEFDLDGARWTIPAARMKMQVEHVVPLSAQAVNILRELQELTNRGPGSLVFPSLRPRRPLSENTLNTALRAMGFSSQQQTAHGFRAMARTLLDEVLGFRPDVIEHQLAHAVRDPNGRAYNRTKFLPQRQVMMQTWANYLDGLKAEGRNTVATDGDDACICKFDATTRYEHPRCPRHVLIDQERMSV